MTSTPNDVEPGARRTEGRLPAPARARLAGWWAGRDPVTRSWIVNILVGVAIHAALVVLHAGAPMGAMENAALDRVMRINAVLDPAPRSGVAPPRQTFIDIDEATWRDPAWGGGEPYRAPRERLLAVVARAFEQGAAQVVLDIAVEGGTARPAEAAEDAAFAAGLRTMLDTNVVKPGQLLVLVRSVRPPLPGTAATAYLNELRPAPPVDALLAEGDPRLALAAPYFTYSSDRVLREWALFSVLCQRHGADGGAVQVLPSVQLVVMAHRLGVLERAAWRRQGTGACVPFPATAQDGPENPLAAARNAQARRDATVDYWRDVSRLLPAHGIALEAEAPADNGIGNRVVYRSGYPFDAMDGFFERMTVPVLLSNKGNGALDGRVAIIGQSYSEGGDVHVTPMGTMPGSAVLMNAIDSMARYGLVESVSPWVTTSLGLVSIVLIGYVFARLDSFSAKLAGTAVILVLFALASVYLFRAGLWLDFALPLLGMQIFQTIREQAGRLDKLRRRAGIGIRREEPRDG